jgi:hypothetical protein
MFGSWIRVGVRPDQSIREVRARVMAARVIIVVELLFLAALAVGVSALVGVALAACAAVAATFPVTVEDDPS